MTEKTVTDPLLIPDIETFEERVAILIFQGGIHPEKAKDLAAQAQGFLNQAHYWCWLQCYVDKRKMG